MFLHGGLPLSTCVTTKWKLIDIMHKLFSEFTTLPLLNVQIKITSWDHKVFHKMFSFEFLFKIPSKIFGHWEIWAQPFCKSYLWFCEKMLKKEILEIGSWTVTTFRFLWWLAKNSRYITTRIFLYLFGFSSLRLIPQYKEGNITISRKPLSYLTLTVSNNCACNATQHKGKRKLNFEPK